MSLPGHTPGQMGLMVNLDTTGWVMLTSDALYLHESYGPPAVGSPIVWESEKWRTSVDRIRTLAIEHEAFIFPGHDTTGHQAVRGPDRDAHHRVLARLRVRVGVHTGTVPVRRIRSISRRASP